MPRDPQILIFVGIRHAVVALDERTGAEMWRTELHSGEYVTVLFDGQSLIAANAGEVWRLDPRNGSILWHNNLKGMGRGIISLASSRQPPSNSSLDSAALKRKKETEEAASAGG